MDRQEFEVTVRETLEGIERAIEQLALDGVETYPAATGMRLQFDDGGFVQLDRNDAAQQIDLQHGSGTVAFYYDTLEEQWFSRDGEQPLLEAVSAELSRRLPARVQLPDLI